MNRTHWLSRGVALLVLCLPAAVFAQDYDDAATGFSNNVNPSGNWKYDYSATLGGAFTSLDYALNWVVDFWTNGLDIDPNVSRNSAAVPATNGTVTWQPGQMALHPGPNGEYSHAVWTAPEDGTYHVFAAFSAAPDSGGGATDVHILRSGAEVFGTALRHTNGSIATSFSFAANLAAGETIDFAVGDGGDGYNFDTTSLCAVITRSPDPLAAGPASQLKGVNRNRTVELSWTASPSANVLYYAVYRSVGQDPLQLLDVIPAGTTFLDRYVVRNKTFNYQVTAVNRSGIESPATNKVSVKVR